MDAVTPIITTEFIKAWGAFGGILLLFIGAIVVLWRALRKCDDENRKSTAESTKVIADLNTTIRLWTEGAESRSRSSDKQAELLLAQAARLEALDVAIKNIRDTDRQNFEQLQKDVARARR